MKFPGLLVCALTFLPVAIGQIITTVAGTGEPGFSGDGGPAIRATFSDPRYLGVDSAGNVYVVDTNNVRIRKVSPSGRVETVAGTGEAAPAARGQATRTGFIAIGAMAVAKNGEIYIADAEGLQKVDPSGALSFVVTGQSVQGVALGPNGVIYLNGVADVSLLGAHGAQKKIAGTDTGDAGDGLPATGAHFYAAHVAVDPSGAIYVVDKEAHRIRKFLAGGKISTFAGNGKAGFGGDHGPADRAELNRPQEMAFDVAGNAYIADTGNFRVRRIGTDGVITTLSGTGESSRSGDGGPAALASFNDPGHIAVGCSGVYVTDTESIRKIALTEPLIAYNGVFDAKGKRSISPLQPFTVTGCNFTDGTVTINGVPVTVSSTGSNQIMGMVPKGIAPGLAKVVVSVNGKAGTAAFVSCEN